MKRQVAIFLPEKRPPAVDQRWFPIESVVGLEVLTEGGDRVGEITDADLDDKTLAVKSYVLRNASGAWRRLGRIHPDEVVTATVARIHRVHPGVHLGSAADVFAHGIHMIAARSEHRVVSEVPEKILGRPGLEMFRSVEPEAVHAGLLFQPDGPVANAVSHVIR